MKVLQHYYTSCKGKGFQTNAASSGLDEDTIRFLERIGLYIPPLSMPSRPTDEDLKKFPVSLSYFRLQDQISVINNSTYVGKDYSGRFGNYFSHSLVIDDFNNNRKNILPIQLWGSPVWVVKECESSELPQLESLEAGSFINWDKISNFLDSNDHLSRFPYLLTAVIEGLKIKKRIIIVDSNQNIALWIAAVTHLIPRDLAKQITFSTYNKNPYALDILICGITLDSDFHFTEQEINFEYSVFDFEDNRYSPIDKIDPFAEVVTQAFSNKNFKILDNFSVFYTEVISYSQECKYDLNDLFSLYSVFNNIPISESDWQRVIRMIISYDFINLLHDLTYKIVGKLSEVQFSGRDFTFCVINLYEKILLKSDNSLLIQESAKVFFNVVILNYLPIANDGDLKIISEKTKNIRLDNLPEKYELKCLKVVRDINDITKKINIYRLFTEIKLILPNSNHLGDFLDEDLMPKMIESHTQKLFVDSLGTEFQIPFTNAFGKYLSNNMRNKETIDALSNLISDDLIYNYLISYAIQQKNLSLYNVLYGKYIVHKKEKLKFFIDYYQNYQQCNVESNIVGLDKAYLDTWGASVPTFQEMKKIIEVIHPEDMQQCSFSDVFAGITHNNTDFMNPSPESVLLAGKLLNSSKLSEKNTFLLKYVIKIPKLTAIEKDLEYLYTLSSDKIINTDNSFRKNILELLYRKLIINNKQLEIHTKHVKRLIGNSQKDYLLLYTAYNAAFNHAISEKSFDNRIFVDCFMVWDQLYSSKVVAPGSNYDFLYTQYAKAFYAQKKKTKQIIEKEISKYPNFRGRWALFKEKTERGAMVTINRNIKTLKKFIEKVR